MLDTEQDVQDDKLSECTSPTLVATDTQNYNMTPQPADSNDFIGSGLVTNADTQSFNMTPQPTGRNDLISSIIDDSVD